ncbi:MAG: hypothetical protein KJ717_06500, partial [Proteobacteria bacterium]|nr:hypothetical protein [Pseudomonadota bacterium]
SLSLEEMPSHDHKNPVYKYGKMTPELMTYEALQGGDKKGNYTDNPRPTAKSGEGKPHENMPPFLALTLCRKQ